MSACGVVFATVALSNTERLKLTPDDQVLVVYRALYPHRWMADALEVETSSREFERRYGVSLAITQPEHFTLGALFALSRSAMGARHGAKIFAPLEACHLAAPSVVRG